MIIETFHEGKVKQLYERLAEKGRMQPPGLVYVDSWIDTDLRKCYQVMEAESEELFQEWINNWSDLMDFEIIPVMTSADARERAQLL